MTSEELKSILTEAVASVSLEGATTETILHRVTSAARTLIEQQKEPMATCAGVCSGRQFKESELVKPRFADGGPCCPSCVTRWLDERDMSIADLRKLPLLEKA